MLSLPETRSLLLLLPGSLLPAHRTPSLASSPVIIKSSKLNKKSSLLSFAKRSSGSRSRPIAVERDMGEDDDAEEVADADDDDDDDDSYEGFRSERFGFGPSGYRGKQKKKNYDKDPELAEILGDYVTDPEKAESKMDERLRKKRNKIVCAKTGSSTPMKVVFNQFSFNDSFIWFEFHNALLDKDVSLICDTIRSWHIVGRMGGCNSMNMQLSQSMFDKRPSYDYIQGANADPTTFYNIGNFEVQDNLARVWVDIGIREPLLLDVLVNALTQISSDFVGIKRLVFGGKEFEGWQEGLTSEEAGCSVREI